MILGTTWCRELFQIWGGMVCAASMRVLVLEVSILHLLGVARQAHDVVTLGAKQHLRGVAGARQAREVAQGLCSVRRGATDAEGVEVPPAVSLLLVLQNRRRGRNRQGREPAGSDDGGLGEGCRGALDRGVTGRLRRGADGALDCLQVSKVEEPDHDDGVVAADGNDGLGGGVPLPGVCTARVIQIIVVY